MARRASVLVVGVVAALTVLTAGAWGLAHKFASPAQREAAAAAPSARPVFVQARMGELREQVQGRGRVEAQVQEALVPRATSANAVVTAVFASVGDAIDNGAPLLAVNGSPVLVIESPFPFFRDLGPGASGPDVQRLQLALRSQGYPVEAAERGTYGRSTAQGVQRLLARLPGPAVVQGPAPGLALTQVMTVDRLPARLGQLARVGASVAAATPLGRLDSGRLFVRASLLSGDAAELTQGTTGWMELESGKRVPLRVTSVHETLSADANPTVQVDLLPSIPLSPRQHGVEGLVTIVVRKVAGPSLIVPARALAQAVGGRAQVLKRTQEGLVGVEVEVLGTLDSSASVRPLRPEALTQRDFVQVG
jgi:hypothetical protein